MFEDVFYSQSSVKKRLSIIEAVNSVLMHRSNRALVKKKNENKTLAQLINLSLFCCCCFCKIHCKHLIVSVSTVRYTRNWTEPQQNCQRKWTKINLKYLLWLSRANFWQQIAAIAKFKDQYGNKCICLYIWSKSPNKVLRILQHMMTYIEEEEYNPIKIDADVFFPW